MAPLPELQPSQQGPRLQHAAAATAGASLATGASASSSGSGFNPANVDAKVYLANERTLLTWMRQAVLLGGLGAAACGLASYHHLRGSGGGSGSSGQGLGSGFGFGGGGDWGAAAASVNSRSSSINTGGGMPAAAAEDTAAAAGAAAHMGVSAQQVVSRLGGMALMLLGAGVAAAACRNYYLRVDMIRSGVGSDSARWDSKVLPRLLTGCLAAVMLAVFASSIQAAASR
ncbi:hypothetical protein HYH02_003328 [Chlamydomonas schloesseri]|uniref:DUF202 domain-containing protein n=1 Tax=Chlamydomonas schloesseri TaxID=2026947 RepID=A0A836BAR6_9CHLO|nr:hypothetical protein HYH02_003328 [Chlamydomonas schloesseri]|eukprot:KAG2452304.1 hypothetical protein HYH02_003328 [Chlamydomonas schloesseri]